LGTVLESDVVLAISHYGEAAGLDTCLFTSYDLAWSTPGGAVSMLYLIGIYIGIDIGIDIFLELGFDENTALTTRACHEWVSSQGSQVCEPSTLPLSYRAMRG